MCDCSAGCPPIVSAIGGAIGRSAAPLYNQEENGMESTMGTQPAPDLGTALRFDGKVAVITGAAMRIGRELAYLFARQGTAVIIADIAEEQSLEVVDEIRSHGGAAAFVHTDVGIHSDIRTMIGSA